MRYKPRSVQQAHAHIHTHSVRACACVFVCACVCVRAHVLCECVRALVVRCVVCISFLDSYAHMCMSFCSAMCARARVRSDKNKMQYFKTLKLF